MLPHVGSFVISMHSPAPMLIFSLVQFTSLISQNIFEAFSHISQADLELSDFSCNYLLSARIPGFYHQAWFVPCWRSNQGSQEPCSSFLSVAVQYSDTHTQIL